MVDGNWSPWGALSSCTVTCGPNGIQSRKRDCNNPSPSGGQFCQGPAMESIPCPFSPCRTGKKKYQK